MKLPAIRSEVMDKVQDPSYDKETVDRYINRALAYTAGLIDLPELKGFATVSTVLGQAYASLSGVEAGFSGVLRKVKDSDKDPVEIYPSLDLLFNDYDMDEEGDVEAVALEGSVLWYQKIPVAAETLTCLLFRNPLPLSETNPETTVIPEHLQHKLLVEGVAYFIYDEIEDGIEEPKTNTTFYFAHSFSETSRESGITKLREWVSKTRVNHISSVWRY